MSELGISETATIVIYEQQGVFSAPRAWWMLRTFGAQNVHLLNGDLKSWIAAGLPTESGDVHRAPANFSCESQSSRHQKLLRNSTAHRRTTPRSSTPDPTPVSPEQLPNPASAYPPATCPEPPAHPSLNSSKMAVSNLQRNSAASLQKKVWTFSSPSPPPADQASPPPSSPSLWNWPEQKISHCTTGPGPSTLNNQTLSSKRRPSPAAVRLSAAAAGQSNRLYKPARLRPANVRSGHSPSWYKGC